MLLIPMICFTRSVETLDFQAIVPPFQWDDNHNVSLSHPCLQAEPLL